ncbi:hypothetical protein H5410_061791 [Solanum commersonii]|uniref:SKP1 component dimerisation domain-containing protein n=1 Tax=Solanum commersonii TaxID=4109 RepID=A0A9J5W8Y8_SOLCO|nr:hypothetical protein H5410_061791 [Solanum commersonii]
MSQLELVGALLAANFFDDTQLKEVIIQGFSDRIKGKTIEEICEVFGIVNDYTPEEEEELYPNFIVILFLLVLSSIFLNLKTCDGKVFVLDEAIAVRSQAIKNMVEDDCVSNVIPLPNVHNKTMTKILDMICQEVAYRIKGKIPEEIRKEFDIKNDFTPEEGEDIHKDNAWAFE